jgi:hypothetical protein
MYMFFYKHNVSSTAKVGNLKRQKKMVVTKMIMCTLKKGADGTIPQYYMPKDNRAIMENKDLVYSSKT